VVDTRLPGVSRSAMIAAAAATLGTRIRASNDTSDRSV
jgi:hypothetical protein